MLDFFLSEMNLEILRPVGHELRKNFPFSTFTEQALRARVVIKNWPSSVVIYLGCAVAPAKLSKKNWVVLGMAMKQEEEYFQMYRWDAGKFNLVA